MLTPPKIAENRRLKQRGLAICAATAIAAVCVLVAPRAGAETRAAALVPASLPAPDAAAGANPTLSGDSDIRNRIESTTGLVIAGEKLHGALLRQFYAAHNFEPVWASRQPQAQALVNAVLRAGEHGLDPDMFHGELLRNAAALAPIDRELVLSDAVLGFADALARGAVPIETRFDDEDLTPEPIDVAAVLDQAINSPDPAAAIEALAPHTPAYLALRQALQSYQSAARSAGAVGAAAPIGAPDARPPHPSSTDATLEARLRQVAVNLERLRWLPRDLPADRVWVNTANAQLVLYRDDQPVFTTRVVVGEVDKQTPEFQTTIDSLLFNPPWNVPYSIATKEILPKLAQDPEYLDHHHMVRRTNGAIQQLPGAGTALGQLKFEMQDRFDVYLHDTPLKGLFARDDRRQSHGCVRVQNPRALAALLLGQPVSVINQGIALGYTNRRMLPEPIPVFMVYQTAFAGADGEILFRPDVYQRDGEIWQLLHPAGQAPMAQDNPTGQPRS
ncbi:MAG TPA: L,D-transpeptidase family protein [Stellaceae bacterium]|nr:L,D-transpeptidase family protein [Stellaceae bacterium]